MQKKNLELLQATLQEKKKEKTKKKTLKIPMICKSFDSLVIKKALTQVFIMLRT